MTRRRLRRSLRRAVCLGLLFSVIVLSTEGVRAATEPPAPAEIVAKFLEGQAGLPVWTEPGDTATLNAHGRAVVEALRRAGREGLRPDDYRLPETTDGATLETAVTAVVLRYVTDLQAGRIDPKRADDLPLLTGPG